MPPLGKSTNNEDDYRSSESDLDASDYDDFVIPVQKKGHGPKGNAANAGKTQRPQRKEKAAPGCAGWQSAAKPKAPVKESSQKGPDLSSNISANAVGDPHKSYCKLPTINVVVCGRVDAGKSSLLGRFLSLIGAVDTRAARSAEQPAWILDQGEDERSRGITIDPKKASAVVSLRCDRDPSCGEGSDISGASDARIASESRGSNNNRCSKSDPHFTNTGINEDTKAASSLSYTHVKVNFIDTPGHHDLLPNLVKGAIIAKAAMVIVDIGDFLKEDTNGYFEQHMFMLWSLGVRHFIICINKVDTVDSKESYEDALKLLRERTSLYGNNITILDIPTSGLKGMNLVSQDIEWLARPSLLEALKMVFRVILGTRPTPCLKHHIPQCSHSCGANYNCKGNGNISPGGTTANDSGYQAYNEATVCHIFDIWEESKSSFGCSCYLETGLQVPRKLVSLPSRTQLCCTQLSVAAPMDISGETATVMDRLSDVMNRMSVSNEAYACSGEFIDNMSIKGQDNIPVTGDRLLVDMGTLERISGGNSPVKEVDSLHCRLLVAPGAHHKLTLGYTVDVHVGYFQVAAAIVGLKEDTTASTLKRVTSLWPGQEGVLHLKLKSPLFVHPLPFNGSIVIDPSKTQNHKCCHIANAQRTVCQPGVPLLSRILLRYCGDIVAGGIIVDNAHS